MANKRLVDFDALAAPNVSSLIYVGDFDDSYRESKTTISQLFSAYSPALASIAGLTTAADKMIYTTASNVYAVADLTAYARTLLDDVDASAARTTLGLGTMATQAAADYLALAGGTMVGSLVLAGDPSSALMAATKQYVDNIVLNVHPACNYGTTGALTATYANGASGVGATLTNSGALAAFTPDGTVTTVGQRILVKDQAAPAENGIYTVTTVGSGAVAWVLTRATDYDQAADMSAGDRVDIVGGTSLAGTQFMMTQTAAITVGTTAITWLNVTNTGALLIANNLSDVANAATSRQNLGAFGSVVIQTFTASGTYTPTTNMKYAFVQEVGAGGGGGGASTAAGQAAASTGGASGGNAQRLFTAAEVGASATVTIGAAGTGASGNSAGNAGGNTSIALTGTGTITMTAAGGNGGNNTGASASALNVVASAGGAVTNGGEGSFSGGRAQSAVTFAAAASACGGRGADSIFGAGGYGASNAANDGGAATGYGAGGGGAAAINGGSGTGGNGTAGFVWIMEFI